MGRTNLSVRRFTIADGMVLIAATAIGLAWTGRCWRAFLNGLEIPFKSWNEARYWTPNLIALALPCLAAWTVALPILGARGPGVPWRRLARQPGTAASLAATIVLSFGLLMVAWLIGREVASLGAVVAFGEQVPPGVLVQLMEATPMVGLAVIIAWALLVFQGRWRCERGWIDRAGRLIGAAWILAGAAFAVLDGSR